MRKIRFLLPLVGIVAALGLATVQAATSATQNVTFSVPNTVSIASSGDVTGGSLTSDAQLAGSFTVSSNDTNGITITTAAATATTTESGAAPCVPSKSFPAASVQYIVQPITGMTSGIGGTAPASPANYSTTAANVFATDPTAVGTTMILRNSYFVKVVTASIPPNTTGCSYVFATTWTIAAK